ncbi:hypothetical protein [Nocardiopsis sp. CC223A]|uniref:hypothetical protein n=1 Tax=Nocardiopsis sp. CC223A TaxID=3044051 RepID=UPI00278BE850|nr:hypothetical protein [Nocardiopsis sp. CC223A]
MTDEQAPDREGPGQDAFRPDFAGADPRYAADTDGPVLHVPVVREDGTALGRLWVSRDGTAAGFLPAAGAAGLNAKGAWVRRLIQARAEGLDAVQALRRWTGAPPDDRAGAIPPGTAAEHAEGPDAVRAHLPDTEETAGNDGRGERP